MSYKFKTSFKIFATVAVVSSNLLSLNIAHAGTVVQCGAAVCAANFSVLFNGNSAGGGQFLYDATSGDISLNMDSNSITGNGMIQNGMMTWTMGDGSQISINSLSGNADPIISFGIGASTRSSGATFAMNFDLPVAIDGPINASSSMSYSLTSTTAAGAQIAPINGSVISGWGVDTSIGWAKFADMGVDAGDSFFFIGGPQTQNSPVYSNTNLFAGDLAYDLMSVQIGFSLSPDSAVAMSGFVSQISAVPVPAAVWLFGSGLLGLMGTVVRRRKA